MFLLEVLGGWFVLSCITAPFIGRFIAVNATIAEDAPIGAPQLQPVQSF